MNKLLGLKHKWKLLFFSLLSINIGIIVIICLLLFLPSATVEFPEQQDIENVAGAEFTVQSSKQNVGELVNGYLDKLLKDNDGKYTVHLDEDVELTGVVKAFQIEIPFSIRLEPIVQENGDLILRQKEISLGLLHLPNEQVLRYLKNNLPTPEWVTIDPNKEDIYMAITQMEVKSNFKVKVQQFDLENDDISFRIKVPNETLGL
ncbi:YpmS family protein [Radiobacillus sp. PE A8.2]|uniref:YpmS family protein n=1 Tax=Radiobacillus sp. PE A8.2 TaxID=3380349 RepID=UPI00389081BC